MAQTGFTPISIYYSSTASAVPTAGNLVAGELAINTADGKLYYKDSAGVVQTLATKDTTAGTFTSITDSGNLTFTGTGNRIRGDFNNATLANRVLFQTSTTNANTVIGAIPNGTGVSSQIALYASSDPANAAWLQLGAGANSGTEHRIAGTTTGTGTFLPLTMYTGGSERLRIDTSGNVGIGTASPTGWNGRTLSVASTTNDAGLRIDGNLGSWGIGGGGTATGSNSLRFYNFTSSFEAMRIDSSGNVGIGTASPTEKLSVAGSVAMTDVVIPLNGTTAIGYIGNSNTITGGSATNIGLRAESAMLFATGGSTERMRIDSSGNLMVGTTNSSDSAGSGCKIINLSAGVGPSVALVGSASTNGAGTGFEMYSTGAAAYRFYVGYGGTIFATSTSITGISDQRLKENIVDLPDGLDAVMALKPRKFDWKEGKGKGIKGDRGFIAQEFETVFPDMIEEWKDPAPEGEEPYKAVNANLIPTLVKAIQELNAKLEAQALEIAALKK